MQQVKIGNALYDLDIIERGVPQSNVLGPILIVQHLLQMIYLLHW